MDLRIARIILGAIALLFFQVFVLEDLSLGGLATPHLEVYLMLILPFTISRVGMLATGLIFGLILDMFTDTPGLHASALVLIGWLRPIVAGTFRPPGGYESGDEPRIGFLGIGWFLAYATALTLIHHFALIMLQTFSLSGLGGTLLRILLSTLATLVLLVILEYILTPKRTRR